MNNESTTCSYCGREDAVEKRYDPILRRLVLACEQHITVTVPLADQPLQTTYSTKKHPLRVLIPGDDANASNARHMYRTLRELIDVPVYRVYSSELREDVGMEGPVDIQSPLQLLQEVGLLSFHVTEVKKRHTRLYEIQLTGQAS